MHVGYDHTHDEIRSAAGRHWKRLAGAFALTAGFTLVEIAGAWITGSLALLADAAHMLTDAGGLMLALLAIRFAARPATPEKTYGYLRIEILAALTNAVVLLLLAIYVVYEAWQRFLAPPEILSGPMLAIAVVGLLVNFASMGLLAAGSSESLNVRGAYLEVFGDMLGSLGVIVAALVVMTTGWTLADPLIGAAIGLFILPRTWNLLRRVTNILLEGTPPHVDVELLGQRLLGVAGVTAVHDLHVWTITSGLDAMSAHLVVEDMSDARRILREAHTVLAEFGIEHVTVQIEDEALRAEERAMGV